MRLSTIALPLVTAGIGGLAAGVFAGLVGVEICILTEAPPARALAVTVWGVCCGSAVGFVVGVCRAIDRSVNEGPRLIKTKGRGSERDSD